MGRVITRPRDGYRFTLVASHNGTTPIGTIPGKTKNCPGCEIDRLSLPTGMVGGDHG